MKINEKELWQEFLDWLDAYKDNLPEWVSKEMPMHECKFLWMERIKNEN